MTRSLVRPLTRSLTRSLVRGPSLDADAAAYIDALVSGGATVSSVQSDAIDTFIRAEKAGERWDLIKRMYLPIWGLAAPNAICMRSLTSGTWEGDVDHTNLGYAAGDGTTGLFRFDTSFFAQGLSAASGTMFAARKNVVPNKQIMGSTINGRAYLIGRTGGTGVRTEWLGTGTATDGDSEVYDAAGVLVASRHGGSMRLHHRSSSAVNNLARAYADEGTLVAGASNETAMLVSTNHDGSHYLAFGFGLGMAEEILPLFSLNLKTLWETATELALP